MSNVRMVKIKNMVNKRVGVVRPEYGVNRKWNKKGQEIPLPFDTVEQLLWTTGFRNMIERGILYIENMQDKIDLGLEPYDAVEPENIKVFTNAQIENLLTNTPFVAFKKELEGVGETQLKEIVNYAILHRLVDMQKADYLRQLTGSDILKAITRAQDIERAEEKNTNR